MKLRLSKKEWPWCTSAFSMCNSGWKYWSALMENERENGDHFTVISCIPHGGKNSHAERWAASTGVLVSHIRFLDMPKIINKSAVLSASVEHNSNEEVLSILPYFNMANIVLVSRAHELNSSLCKQIQKLGFAWGLDDGCHGTEIFCSKVDLTYEHK